uniref:Uncharacterized protein n=1 Tax=Magallana gigas TaxID=29159 RepID=A0A8W8J0G4_MAGGI
MSFVVELFFEDIADGSVVKRPVHHHKIRVLIHHNTAVLTQSSLIRAISPTVLPSTERDFHMTLDGKLRHEDTKLASSTIMTESSQKENLGIVVSYRVKVRLILGIWIGRPVVVSKEGENAPVDTDLIQLDTNGVEPVKDDDFIFEDFARLRLKDIDKELIGNLFSMAYQLYLIVVCHWKTPGFDF